MTTLTINETCVKHVPHVASITTIALTWEHEDSYTFCESCEQNIKRFAYYDDERGMVYSRWTVGK